MENVLHHMYNMTKDYEDNIIFTTGVGNHQMQTYQFIKSHYPKKIISSMFFNVYIKGENYLMQLEHKLRILIKQLYVLTVIQVLI